MRKLFFIIVTAIGMMQIPMQSIILAGTADW